MHAPTPQAVSSGILPETSPNVLIYKEEAYRIVGACFEVYNEKGCGFLEAVYQECLEIELALQAIPFRARVPISLKYKQRPLRQRYVADLVCYGTVLLELKAVSEIVDEHRAQLLNYLHATGCRLGLLVNFGHHPKLQCCNGSALLFNFQRTP